MASIVSILRENQVGIFNSLNYLYVNMKVSVKKIFPTSPRGVF
jgi:hypothetical protein